MIWANYGQESPEPGRASGNTFDNEEYSYPWNDFIFPSNVGLRQLPYNYDMDNLTEEQQRQVISTRLSFPGSRFGGVSGTYQDDNHFWDVNYASQSLKLHLIWSVEDFIIGMMLLIYPELVKYNFGPGWAFNYRVDPNDDEDDITKEHWQYIDEYDFYVSHIEDIGGFMFPAC